MLSLFRPDGILSVRPSQPIYSGTSNSSHTVQSSDANFDQASFSPEPVGDQRFQKELISRLSQEVRTSSTPTNELQNICQQIADGTYQPDPSETAAKILLIQREEP